MAVLTACVLVILTACVFFLAAGCGGPVDLDLLWGGKIQTQRETPAGEKTLFEWEQDLLSTWPRGGTPYQPSNVSR